MLYVFLYKTFWDEENRELEGNVTLALYTVTITAIQSRND